MSLYIRCITVVLGETYEDLGIGLHPPPVEDKEYRKDYQYPSLANPSGTGAALRQLDPKAEYAAAIYRGMIPAKNILERDFAINGAIVSFSLIHVKIFIDHWTFPALVHDKQWLRVPR